jgi:hypothetical protein
MASLKRDIKSSSEWISTALMSEGYRADFTPSSLIELDRFFSEQSEDGTAKADGLLAEGLGQRLFAIGSYMGEVVRQTAGGEWVTNDRDPQGEINVELRLPDGTICWPVQRAMKRFKNGAEDGVAVWGIALGLSMEPTQPKLAKGWFHRLLGS